MIAAPAAVKAGGDGLSIGTIILVLLDKMPSIAALAALIWTLIRIWETDTIQNFVHRKKIREQRRRKSDKDGAR